MTSEQLAWHVVANLAPVSDIHIQEKQQAAAVKSLLDLIRAIARDEYAVIVDEILESRRINADAEQEPNE